MKGTHHAVRIDKTATRLNAMCPYFTMFPLAVPLHKLRGARAESFVLDPFCGRGTTNFAARLMGLSSVGIDSNPVAAAIAEAKLVDVTARQVEDTCKQILSTQAEGDTPDGRFWELAFHRDTLSDIVRLREALHRSCTTPARKALRGLLLGLLHGPKNRGLPSYFSNQMPRTFSSKPDYSVRYWTQERLVASYVDVRELVQRKASYYFAGIPDEQPHEILCADSRTISLARLRRQVTHVVTSPPYYGMRTYVPDQWLRNWFVGGPASVEYRQPNQLTHGSPDEFLSQLGRVWTNVAEACAPGARFVIRFGGINDRDVTPRLLLLESLARCARRLRITAIRSAGLASRGKRQADQFRRRLGVPVEELDVFATLED